MLASGAGGGSAAAAAAAGTHSSRQWNVPSTCPLTFGFLSAALLFAAWMLRGADGPSVYPGVGALRVRYMGPRVGYVAVAGTGGAPAGEPIACVDVPAAETSWQGTMWAAGRRDRGVRDASAGAYAERSATKTLVFPADAAGRDPAAAMIVFRDAAVASALADLEDEARILNGAGRPSLSPSLSPADGIDPGKGRVKAADLPGARSTSPSSWQDRLANGVCRVWGTVASVPLFPWAAAFGELPPWCDFDSGRKTRDRDAEVLAPWVYRAAARTDPHPASLRHWRDLDVHELQMPLSEIEAAHACAGRDTMALLRTAVSRRRGSPVRLESLLARDSARALDAVEAALAHTREVDVSPDGDDDPDGDTALGRRAFARIPVLGLARVDLAGRGNSEIRVSRGDGPDHGEKACLYPVRGGIEAGTPLTVAPPVRVRAVDMLGCLGAVPAPPDTDAAAANGRGGGSAYNEADASVPSAVRPRGWWSRVRPGDAWVLFTRSEFLATCDGADDDRDKWDFLVGMTGAVTDTGQLRRAAAASPSGHSRSAAPGLRPSYLVPSLDADVDTAAGAATARARGAHQGGSIGGSRSGIAGGLSHGGGIAGGGGSAGRRGSRRVSFASSAAASLPLEVLVVDTLNAHGENPVLAVLCFALSRVPTVSADGGAPEARAVSYDTIWQGCRALAASPRGAGEDGAVAQIVRPAFRKAQRAALQLLLDRALRFPTTLEQDVAALNLGVGLSPNSRLALRFRARFKAALHAAIQELSNDE